MHDALRSNIHTQFKEEEEEKSHAKKKDSSIRIYWKYLRRELDVHQRKKKRSKKKSANTWNCDRRGRRGEGRTKEENCKKKRIRRIISQAQEEEGHNTYMATYLFLKISCWLFHQDLFCLMCVCVCARVRPPCRVSFPLKSPANSVHPRRVVRVCTARHQPTTS